MKLIVEYLIIIKIKLVKVYLNGKLYKFSKRS